VVFKNFFLKKKKKNLVFSLIKIRINQVLNKKFYDYSFFDSVFILHPNKKIKKKNLFISLCRIVGT